MNNKHAHEGVNKAICAVNRCTRLIYTRKTRCDVFYARFERADTVSVRWGRWPKNGLRAFHMMQSRFVCIRCFKTTRTKTGFGVCLNCFSDDRNFDYDIHYDGDDDDTPYEYDYFQDPCPICGNYEICDDEHHKRYEASRDGLSSQIANMVCICCGDSLYHCYPATGDDLCICEYAVVKCKGCIEVYYLLHDENYQAITTIRFHPPTMTGKYQTLPVNFTNDDEIPF